LQVLIVRNALPIQADDAANGSIPYRSTTFIEASE